VSYTPCAEADDRAPTCPNSIDMVIIPRTGDIGGFEVMRALPSAKKRMVGPFVFWDQMGPGHFAAGKGLDVRPHPHIGLSTVTYLFEGAMGHKDSLGNDLVIHPGAVNLMTAGKGIVHSERSDPESRAAEADLFGIQSWLALPQDLAEIEPSFTHYPAADIPSKSENGADVTVIMGSAFGLTSPVKTHWETLYAALDMDAGASLDIAADTAERALYVVSGTISIAGEAFPEAELIVLRTGAEVTVTAADGPVKVMLLGGAPMDGPRYIWWNFVSHSKDRIKAAAEAWQNGDFPKVAGDAEEFIPLPDIDAIQRLKL